MWRYVGLGTGALLSSWVVWVNIGVHRAPRVGSEEELVAARAQLAYLEQRMHAGLPDAMQRLFPEGAVFTDALYGLAWCQLAQRSPMDKALRVHALTEARYALADMERPSVQARFASADTLTFGVFYTGWRNLLIGAIALLDTKDTALQARWEEECATLRNAFGAARSPFLCSYPGMAWPADNVVAMASLARHARAHGITDDAVLRNWVDRVRMHRDERGLVPHAWDPVADRMAEASRGSSQVLMNALLPTVDSALAAEQFQGFCTHFLMERCGVPVVREHPHDVMRSGDVDSGPVILGAGASATVVGAAAFRANGDLFHAQELDATCEGFGLATGEACKRYLLGVLPITDLFIVWARTWHPPVGNAHTPGFVRFHLWSAGLITLLLAAWWFPWARRCWRGRARYLGGMQRSTFLLLLLSGPATLTAQPVIDAGSAPAVGQIYDYDIADPLNLPGTGPGQVWDASGAQVNTNAQLQYIAPGMSTAGSSFPDADVVQDEGGNETFLEVGADGLYVIGSYAPGLPITSVFTDPQRVMAYPCSLGTAWTDAYEGSYTYQGNTYQQQGTDQFEATGYGSFQFPWGTMDNVLRIDGSSTYTESGNGNTYVYDATFTLFHKPGLGNFVARLLDGSATLNGAPAGAVQNLVMMQASSIGVEEMDLAGIGVELFPNPSEGVAEVVHGSDGDLDIRVVDAAGRTVLHRPLGVRAPGIHRDRIDLQGEAPGLYTVMVERADGVRGCARLLVTR